jgi:hypothetical protein
VQPINSKIFIQLLVIRLVYVGAPRSNTGTKWLRLPLRDMFLKYQHPAIIVAMRPTPVIDGKAG